MSVRIYNATGTTRNIKVSKNLAGILNDIAPEQPVYELPYWISSGDLGT